MSIENGKQESDPLASVREKLRLAREELEAKARVLAEVPVIADKEKLEQIWLEGRNIQGSGNIEEEISQISAQVQSDRLSLAELEQQYLVLKKEGEDLGIEIEEPETLALIRDRIKVGDQYLSAQQIALEQVHELKAQVQQIASDPRVMASLQEDATVEYKERFREEFVDALQKNEAEFSEYDVSDLGKVHALLAETIRVNINVNIENLGEDVFKGLVLESLRRTIKNIFETKRKQRVYTPYEVKELGQKEEQALQYIEQTIDDEIENARLKEIGSKGDIIYDYEKALYLNELAQQISQETDLQGETIILMKGFDGRMSYRTGTLEKLFKEYEAEREQIFSTIKDKESQIQILRQEKPVAGFFVSKQKKRTQDDIDRDIEQQEDEISELRKYIAEKYQTYQEAHSIGLTGATEKLFSIMRSEEEISEGEYDIQDFRNLLIGISRKKLEILLNDPRKQQAIELWKQVTAHRKSKGLSIPKFFIRPR